MTNIQERPSLAPTDMAKLFKAPNKTPAKPKKKTFEVIHVENDEDKLLVEFSSEAPSKQYLTNLMDTLFFAPVLTTDFVTIPSGNQDGDLQRGPIVDTSI